ncbi:fibroblast growth factor 10-like [Nelusetta ayraudi]|uniref:fibroblast growth factor 10-like n=1 Tax=Nelusetta ayraudi TaxID=303726 RepID=UPI003F70B216
MCRWTVTQAAPLARRHRRRQRRCHQRRSSSSPLLPPLPTPLALVLLLVLLGPSSTSSSSPLSAGAGCRKDCDAPPPPGSPASLPSPPPPAPPATSSSSSSSSSSASARWPRAANASSATVVGRHVRSSYNHLQGDVRKRKLHSFRNFFLRIDKKGKVNGTQSEDDPYSILEIKSVDVGVVAIRSLSSNFYLAISWKGEVYGSRDYGPDCRLIERIEENKYNTYASAVWRHKNKHMFIGMTANGKIINAKKGRRRNINCHFLPLMVQPR